MQFEIGTGGLYRALIDRILNWLPGKSDDREPSIIPPPAPDPPSLQIPADGVKLLIAARRSRALGGEWVSIDDPDLQRERFDGAAFGREYAARRRAPAG